MAPLESQLEPEVEGIDPLEAVALPVEAVVPEAVAVGDIRPHVFAGLVALIFSCTLKFSDLIPLVAVWAFNSRWQLSLVSLMLVGSFTKVNPLLESVP